MKIVQKEFTISPKGRGFHLVTENVERNLPEIREFERAVLNLFLKHTSASLCISENADPSVRHDLESFFKETCDNKSYYTHTLEGEDDMPAHIKNSIMGVSLNIPITDGCLNMGVWQGIYLNEHRDCEGSRDIVATITGK